MMIKWDAGEERRLYGGLNSVLANDLKRRGRNAVQAARTPAPVRTGLLKSSIDARLGMDRQGLFLDLIATARNPRGFPYPVVQEERRPFMRPAVIAMRH